MIGVFEALDWLNAIDGRTFLKEEELRLSMRARTVSLSGNDVTAVLNQLRDEGLASVDLMERAEVFLHIASIEYWRREFLEAARDAIESIRVYRMLSDTHRRAAAAWILGMALWERAENNEAYVNWTDAKEIFQNRQIQFRNSPNEREWYEAWIWQMDLELTVKPEEIFTWLDRFRDNPSNLSPSSRQVADLIAENIRQRRYPDVYALIRDIQQINRLSSSIYERAEVFFHCGFAAYQIGNLDSSIELLRRAVQDLAPGRGNNHKQIVALCMLGAVEWLTPETRTQAAIDWIRSIEEFRELMLQADRCNDQLGRQWYADRIALIEAALAERLPGGTPQGRKPGNLNPPAPAPTPAPQDDGPGPSTSPSDGQERSPYETLLSMVGRDAEIAERLINFEQGSAPNASRDELIQRAIERLLRDRR